MKFKRIFTFLLGALLLSTSTPFMSPVVARQAEAASQPRAQEVRPKLPPARYIPSHDYDTRDITLNLRFDFEREWAIGTATITFAPLLKDLRRIELDAGNMTINSVKFARGTSSNQPLQFDYDANNEKLRIALDRAYQPTDVLTVVIDYHTNGALPNQSINGGGGLTFIKPTVDDPKRPRQIWSQGETEYNHYWFPCYDHPNDFTTSEIIATVEKPLTVISNGRLVSVKENSDNTRTFDWKIAAPHATYLTSIVVGEYVPIEQSYDGIPVITYVYPNEVNEGRVTAARMADMVRFFSEKTGVRYPYEKYAQTVAHDFNGGMENISATTQTDKMIHDARTELDQTADSLQSHELAHQWFGNYVTCRSWSDIWLNESFATYFQALWDEKSLGRDDFLYLDVKGNQDQYFAAWNRGQRRPIVTKNYANPDAVFDAYAYPRGGAVLHMLRRILGEENWWRAINHYLTKYAHQPVQTEQFRIAIEEATGQSMDWFFDEWLYKMGHPIFRVTQNYDAATKTLTLNVRQEQKPDPGSAYPQVTLFQTPVEIEIGTATVTRIERAMIEPKEEQSLTFAVDGPPLLVNFDYGSTLIKELKFDKTTEQLTYQLARDEDPLGRISALNQLGSQLKDTAATISADKENIISAISAAATNDKFWGVRLESVTALSGAPNQRARTALLTATKDQNSRVRARAVASLAASKDATLADVYLTLLGDPSYGVIRAAARALGQTKSPRAYVALNKLLDASSWRDTIRASGLMGLATLGDPRSLEAAVRYAMRGNPAAVRASAISVLGEVGKGDPRAYPIIADALAQGLGSNNFQLGTAAAESLVALGDPRGLELFKEARARLSSNPRAQAILTQSEKRLEEKQPKANAVTPK